MGEPAGPKAEAAPDVRATDSAHATVGGSVARDNQQRRLGLPFRRLTRRRILQARLQARKTSKELIDAEARETRGLTIQKKEAGRRRRPPE